MSAGTTARRARPDELVACRAVRHAVFVEGQGVPLAVPNQLHLDMAGAGDEFFQEHAVVGKVVGAEPLHRVEGTCQKKRRGKR